MFGQLVVRVSQREEIILSWQYITGPSHVVLEADDPSLENAATRALRVLSPCKFQWFIFLKNS